MCSVKTVRNFICLMKVFKYLRFSESEPNRTEHEQNCWLNISFVINDLQAAAEFCVRFCVFVFLGQCFCLGCSSPSRLRFATNPSRISLFDFLEMISSHQHCERHTAHTDKPYDTTMLMPQLRIQTPAILGILFGQRTLTRVCRKFLLWCSPSFVVRQTSEWNVYAM